MACLCSHKHRASPTLGCARSAFSASTFNNVYFPLVIKLMHLVEWKENVQRTKERVDIACAPRGTAAPTFHAHSISAFCWCGCACMCVVHVCLHVGCVCMCVSLHACVRGEKSWIEGAVS